ncbi:MAG: 2-polyprenyl-6-methoxyphenol hydroxylase-like FAD-dependent oxidoreductase [Gammaproteobacteria bacterium]
MAQRLSLKITSSRRVTSEFSSPVILVKLNHIDILGAGPAGLYTAILLKINQPSCDVQVTDQNGEDDTFGFGVVFSDRALDFLKTDDPDTHALITPRMQHWQDMTLSVMGEQITLDGIGFSAIGRLTLLKIFQQRALDLGVRLVFDEKVGSDSLREFEDRSDLIIGADGLNSLVRQSNETGFEMTKDLFSNHFAWFGTDLVFDNLTQTFVRSSIGALNAHHYRYSENMSTFIVECDHKSFIDHGFSEMDEYSSAGFCSKVFADTLDGHSLITNQSHWRQFPRLWCNNWAQDKKVIIGDAAHTAHFSIGSGTRLALEDSIALVGALNRFDDLSNALSDFQENRQPIVEKIVKAANTSAVWYEDFSQKMELPLPQFAFDYLSRSGRVDLERLRQISPGFVSQYEQFTG